MEKIVTGKTAQNTAGDKHSVSTSNAKFQHQSLLVHTVFGVSLVSANSTVYVKIGDEYAVKSADEIKKGEEVLFAKEGIPGITIDKVAEALAKSDRYAATQPVLFRQIAGGAYTTAFKHALFQGMATAPRWPSPIASDAAFKFGVMNGHNVELNGAQAFAAAGFIHSALEEASVPPVTAEQIIYGWLSGRTIAPRNHNGVFAALAPFAPKLTDMLGQDFDEAYRLYVVIRQTVMRTVSLILHGTGTEMHEKTGCEEPPKQGISTKPEIKLVVDHFASDIGKNYAAGRVLGVEELKPSLVPNQNEERGGVFKGIVTTKIREPEIKVKGLKQIAKERSVLLPIMHRILYEFAMREKIPDDAFSKHSMYKRDMPLARALLNVICHELSFSEGYNAWVYGKVNERFRKAGIMPLLEYRQPAKDGKEAQIARIFRDKLYRGELDAVYGLKLGTIENLFNYEFNLEEAMPLDFEYSQFLVDYVYAKATREQMTGIPEDKSNEMRELDRMNKRMIMRGLDGGIYKATSEVHTAICMTEHMLGGAMDDQIYSGKISPMDALLQSGENLESLRQKKFLSDDELALVELRRIGFSHLEFLYPKANELVKPYF